MKQFMRRWRSFYKNIIIKRKFKSYIMYFTDQEYRAQVDNIYKITSKCTASRMVEVPTHLLVHGHKVVYREYSNNLIFNDKAELEPIKVILHKGNYVVIDGNHRLPAIISRSKRHNTWWTKCELIY